LFKEGSDFNLIDRDQFGIETLVTDRVDVTLEYYDARGTMFDSAKIKLNFAKAKPTFVR
jgi:hypothetical protein